MNDKIDVLTVPFRVSQTYFQGVNLPRYCVIGPGNIGVRYPATMRCRSRLKTWGSEAKAQAHADILNAMAAESAAERAEAIARVTSV